MVGVAAQQSGGTLTAELCSYNGYGGKCSVLCLLPQFKKKELKKVQSDEFTKFTYLSIFVEHMLSSCI